MFYYCPKCADIVNIKGQICEKEDCRVCGGKIELVPSEYLSGNGIFFKSQEDRERFIQNIKSSDSYDAAIGNKKEEIKRQKEEEEQAHIEEMNRKMQEEQFEIRCPVCGKSNVKKISTVGKYAKVYAFGLLGADSLGKKWVCNICGAKF